MTRGAVGIVPRANCAHFAVEVTHCFSAGMIFQYVYLHKDRA